MNREITAAVDIVREHFGNDAAAVAWVLLAYGSNRKVASGRAAGMGGAE